MAIRMVLQGEYESLRQFVFALESAPEFVIIDDLQHCLVDAALDVEVAAAPALEPGRYAGVAQRQLEFGLAEVLDGRRERRRTALAA